MLRHKGNKENNRNFTTYYHIYIYIVSSMKTCRDAFLRLGKQGGR